MQKEIEEDSQYRHQLEQERRDHELAVRLAEETNGQVDDSPLLMRKYVGVFSFILALTNVCLIFVRLLLMLGCKQRGKAADSHFKAHFVKTS